MTSSISEKDREMIITRIIDAPRELVWRAWTEPEHLVKWWGPDGFTNTFKEISVKPGGVWRFTMHGPDGVDYPNKIVFDEIVKPERMRYTHTDDSENGQLFRSTVTFEEQGTSTKVTLRAVFETVAEYEEAKKYAVEGGNQTLGRLAEHLKTMQ